MTDIIFADSEISQMQTELVDSIAMFNSRFLEAENYINYLALIEKRGTTISLGTCPNLFEIDREFLKICRANGYILLYNLIESTIYEATSGLYKHLEANIVDVDKLIDNLKILVFKGIQNSTQENFKVFKNDLNIQFRDSIFKICFEKAKIKKMFSGNLDAKKIREFSEEHGISLNLLAECNNGGKLIEIKNTRNDLAHGSASFSSKGAISANALNNMCQETGYYLRSVITSINSFLEQQSYHKAIQALAV
ncbi:hypothetical protein HUN19_12695 [Acinetobacter oleivorans]|uniref:MAE_28990/MAE_18760 family HEPN-like nuclease n=1 Tax=Acinetobacter oleivorans TaxID=1148157 RepID=UPI001580CE03|nr:MAE_28990/MAE_18760 family HEPN-like nuclease [Acinetobacter oleivorans]NUF34844.1 hypothetical protein [Acinetobacter oleivorans]